MAERFHRRKGGYWEWDDEKFYEKDVDDVFMDVIVDDHLGGPIRVGFATVKLKDGTTYALDGWPYYVDDEPEAAAECLSIWRSRILGIDDNEIESKPIQTEKRPLKSIETYCDGFRFRSRLEARWYMAFKTWGANLRYETEGYDLEDGVLYLPDFLIRDVIVICHPDDYPPDWGDPFSSKNIYFEVKGNMTEEDSEKIRRFSETGSKIFTVGDIPNGPSIDKVINDISEQHLDILFKDTFDNKTLVCPFSAGYLGIDACELIPCALKNETAIFGLVDPSFEESILRIDIDKTMEGYNLARQARFEHGECGMKSEPIRRECQYSGANSDPDEWKKIAFEDF